MPQLFMNNGDIISFYNRDTNLESPKFSFAHKGSCLQQMLKPSRNHINIGYLWRKIFISTYYL